MLKNTIALLIAIAFAGLAHVAGRWHRAAGTVVVIGALALAFHAADPSLRAHTHPVFEEDVRAQVRYVDAHRRPGDHRDGVRH